MPSIRDNQGVGQDQQAQQAQIVQPRAGQLGTTKVTKKTVAESSRKFKESVEKPTAERITAQINKIHQEIEETDAKLGDLQRKRLANYKPEYVEESEKLKKIKQNLISTERTLKANLEKARQQPAPPPKLEEPAQPAAAPVRIVQLNTQLKKLKNLHAYIEKKIDETVQAMSELRKAQYSGTRLTDKQKTDEKKLPKLKQKLIEHRNNLAKEIVEIEKQIHLQKGVQKGQSTFLTKDELKIKEQESYWDVANPEGSESAAVTRQKHKTYLTKEEVGKAKAMAKEDVERGEKRAGKDVYAPESLTEQRLFGLTSDKLGFTKGGVKVAAPDIDQMHRTDFRTKNTKQARTVAMQTANGLMASAATGNSVFVTSFPTKSPRDQFKELINSYMELIDPNHPNHIELDTPAKCNFLSLLAAQLSKGFASSNGGIGAFNSPGWQREWGEIGDNIFDPRSTNVFRPGPANAANNTRLLEDFKKMLEYYQNSADEHFSSNRHPAGVELASVQVAATLGQLLHDFVLDPSKDQTCRNNLKQVMVSHGLIDSSKFSEVEHAEKLMRECPLLAEAGNPAIKSKICDAVRASGNNASDVHNLLKQELSTHYQNFYGKYVTDESSKLLDKVLTKFTESINGIKTTTPKSSTRARAAVEVDARKLGDTTLRKAAVKTVTGAKEGNPNTIAVMPDRITDDLATSLGKERLMKVPGLKDGLNALTEAIEKKEILKHAGSPETILRLGNGLDGNIAAFVREPEKHLDKALTDLINDPQMDQADKRILTAFRDSFRNDPSLVNELREGIGKIETNINGADRSQVATLAQQAGISEDPDKANLGTAAQIMYKNNARTICSVSGTTVDIIAGLTLEKGVDPLKKLFQPLYDYSMQFEATHQGPIQPLDSFPGAEDCKKFISSLGFFMQSGQYHTAGEVLGGCLMASRTLCGNEADNGNIEQTFQTFEGVMEQFGKDPTQFFSLPQGVRDELHNVDHTTEDRKKLDRQRVIYAQENIALAKRAATKEYKR